MLPVNFRECSCAQVHCIDNIFQQILTIVQASTMWYSEVLTKQNID